MFDLIGAFIILLILILFISFCIIFIFARYIGREGVIVVSSFIFLLSIFISSVLLYNLTGNGVTELVLFNWIGIGSSFDWVFIVDFLSVNMVLLISFITFMIVIYSFSYMKNDPHFSRFIASLIFFGFSMVFLVLSGNLLQLFIGWEGVGLASFLLINFWHTRLEANRAAVKAIIFNRIGDFGFILGTAVTSLVFGTTEPYLIFCLLNTNKFQLYSLIHVIAFLFLLAAIAKSAQILFHAWLADAMEGPTPVSALLHSATMVTVGVFLLLRLSFFFVYSSFVANIVLLVGSFTALLGSTIALFQFDIKKIIAYSTCSQLGLMVASFGMLNFYFSFFHLINHAFFKALLFLISGSIIHALNNEQDIRKMGGLFSYMPFTFICAIIASLSLCGFPAFSGFMSKEGILFFGFYGYSFLNKLSFFFLFFSSVFTILYSVRFVYFVFLSSYRGAYPNLFKIHEPDLQMSIPIFLLTLISIYFAYFSFDYFVGLGDFSKFITFPFVPNSFDLILQDISITPFFRNFLPLVTVFSFIYVSKYYKLNKFNFILFSYSRFISRGLQYMYVFFLEKWLFSSFYRIVVFRFYNFSYKKIFILFDRGVAERFQLFLIQSIVNLMKVTKYNIVLLNLSMYLLILSVFLLVALVSYVFGILHIVMNSVFLFWILFLEFFYIGEGKRK